MPSSATCRFRSLTMRLWSVRVFVLARRADHAVMVRSAGSRAADHERAAALSAQVRGLVDKVSSEHGQQVRALSGASSHRVRMAFTLCPDGWSAGCRGELEG